MTELEQNQPPEPVTESASVSVPARHCLNCGEPLRGDFCHRCGQQDKALKRFFPTLVLESLEGLFALDSRTWRTLWMLFSSPASLSREYLKGRRAHYLPPTRVFIVFLLAALFTISLELLLNSMGITFDDSVDDTALDQDYAGTDGGGPDSDSGFNAELELEGDIEELESGIREVVGRLRIPFLSEEDNQQVVALLQDRSVTNIAAIQQDPRDFINQSLEYLPILLLVMMPMLALIQQLFYVMSGRYYIEHLVLTINNHTFLFLCFILLFLLDVIAWTGIFVLAPVADILHQALNLWILVYLFLSLRRFFGQGYALTAVKFVLISLTYGAVFLSSGLFLILISALMY